MLGLDMPIIYIIKQTSNYGTWRSGIVRQGNIHLCISKSRIHPIQISKKTNSSYKRFSNIPLVGIAYCIPYCNYIFQWSKSYQHFISLEEAYLTNWAPVGLISAVLKFFFFLVDLLMVSFHVYTVELALYTRHMGAKWPRCWRTLKPQETNKYTRHGLATAASPRSFEWGVEIERPTGGSSGPFWRGKPNLPPFSTFFTDLGRFIFKLPI